MPIYSLGDKSPNVDPSVWVAPGAQVVGDVVIGPGSGVWFNAVIRGDSEAISIGENTNIQDGTVLHADPGKPLMIGNGVTVGHQAMLHGCQIGDGSLVGIGSIILNGARVGKNCLVAAGSLIAEGKVFEDNTLILGSPARSIKTLTESEIEKHRANAVRYRANAARYFSELHEISDSHPKDSTLPSLPTTN